MSVSAESAATGPLQGVRIADFCAQGAGPYGTELLSFLGAEVIHVESKRRPDLLRQRSPGQWNDLNLGKLGVAIDLAHPSGVELAKRLVKVSDVAAESFRPGVMERLGLGYEALREVKPDIIMASLSGFGQDGPERSFASWAPIFAAMGGLENLTGYADGIPTEQRAPLDLMAGQLLAFAILPALLYRQRTGRGQHIDFAVREGIISALGDAVLEYTLNGREPVRKGNRDNVMAPHDCYRCEGEDRWVSIAVGNDEEWRALCKAIDRPHLAHDPKFADRLNRWRNQDLLRGAIEEWTSGRTPQHAAEQLQATGVAAFPSMSAADIFSDPHLQARGFLMEMEHPELGKRKAMAPPWKLSLTPAGIDRAGPVMGQHNNYVFNRLVGLTEEEVAELEKEGALY